MDVFLIAGKMLRYFSQAWLSEHNRRKERKMHLSRKHLAIIVLATILVVTNIAFAVLYMTKNLNISGGVQTVGAIEVYDSDGVTPLTSYDFPRWNPGEGGTLTKKLFINNTGNVPVYVYWNISSSSIVWTGDSTATCYEHIEGIDIKYTFRMYKTYGDIFKPDAEFTTPSYRNVDIGIGREVNMELVYSGIPATAETFTFVVTFYARDPV